MRQHTPAKTRKRHEQIASKMNMLEWKVVQETIFGTIFIRRVNTTEGYEYLIGRHGKNPGEYTMSKRPYNSYHGAKNGVKLLWLNTPPPNRPFAEEDVTLRLYREERWKKPGGFQRKRNITTRKDNRIRRNEKLVFLSLKPGQTGRLHEGIHGKVNIVRKLDGSGPWFQIAVRVPRHHKLGIGEFIKRRGRKGLKTFVFRRKLYPSYREAYEQLRDWAISVKIVGERMGARGDETNL